MVNESSNDINMVWIEFGDRVFCISCKIDNMPILEHIGVRQRGVMQQRPRQKISLREWSGWGWGWDGDGDGDSDGDSDGDGDGDGDRGNDSDGDGYGGGTVVAMDTFTQMLLCTIRH